MIASADLNPPEKLDEFIEREWEMIESVEDKMLSPAQLKSRAPFKAFAEERVRGVLSEREELDEILAPLLEDWEIHRLGTVERAVMRMGIWELKNSDVPVPVVINEAVDLANWFSTPKSRALINGVLDRYAKSRA